MDKVCKSCEFWEFWRRVLVITGFGPELEGLGHCKTRTIGGLTAEDYTCGEWQEKPDD